MTPILFPKDATTFTSLGQARLPDAISCTVTEERNGQYELEMVYPVTGAHFDEIAEDMIIASIPCDGGTKQGFRIYKIATPINGQVAIFARHISYQLNFIPIGVKSGSGTAQTAMNGLKAEALETCPFTFTSDISGSKSYAIAAPANFRTALGGMEGSILDTYGGEFEWDNWTVKLLSARGADNGVRITYGKNLTSVERSVDIGSLITGVAAFWRGQDKTGADTIVYSNPRVISNAHVSDYAHSRTITLDVTDAFETIPTTAQVTAYATSYLAGTTLASVSEAVTVDFVPLWQSPEYIDYAPLERVKLCDTVYMGYRQLGISVKKKVTKTVYNVLLDRYDSIELGGETTVADTISELTSNSSDNARNMAKLAAELATIASPNSYRIYYAVSQLGITAGSATVTSCWNAMPTQSILIAGVGNFASSAVPYASAYGQVVIVKNTNTNGYIYLHGLTESAGDYRMYLTGSPQVPSETWIPVRVPVRSAVLTASTGTYDTASYGLRKVGSIVTCQCRVTGVNVSTSFSAFASIPAGYRPKATLNRVLGFANLTPVAIYISTTGSVSVQGGSAISNASVIFTATWSVD